MPLENGAAVEADLAAYAEMAIARGTRRLNREPSATRMVFKGSIC